MICRLCLADADLCRSHVIPELAYRPAYDDTGRGLRISPDERKPETKFQTGTWERLFCRDCEDLFSKLEKYFSDAWMHNVGVPDNLSDAPTILRHSVDYSPFKLFHLSLLWRASVATRQDFVEVSLGRKHEERIRDMLLSHTPGPYDCYPILACYLVRDGKNCYDVLMPPRKARVQGHTMYIFVFGSCVWFYIVSSHSFGKGSSHMLQDDGTIRLKQQPLNTFSLTQALFSRLLEKHPKYVEERTPDA